MLCTIPADILHRYIVLCVLILPFLSLILAMYFSTIHSTTTVGGVEKLAFLWGTPERISLSLLVAIAILQVYSKIPVLHTQFARQKVKKVRGGGTHNRKHRT